MSPSALFQSSGDMLADRRYEYARDLWAEGDVSAAVDLVVQALERAPRFAAAWFLFGEIRERLKDSAAAIDAYRQALDADPDDRHGAALRLARLGVKAVRPAMSPAYVRTLFDQYAPRFDKALTEDLAYRAPKLMFEATFEACETIGRERWFDKAFDLGCGTGLAGQAFAPRIDSLEGVDLSPGMAALARRRGCYSTVHVGDMLAFLGERGIDGADLLIAADSLVYLEELDAVFAAAARVLEQHGLFVFTLEAHDGEGVVLGEKLRYAHAPDHVRAALASAGLVPVILRHVSTRLDGNIPVPGLLVVAEQRDRPPPPVE
jgi:predicted TPR repeat methyltransferase